ncbi:MAG: BASS family bile acid:Na+ symporter [Myxococcota bacterium]|jgi:BASS family bile acid:Na+ symporter
MSLIAFGFANAFGYGGAVAVGLIVPGSSSDGTTSNLFSDYGRGVLALSISMTITSTIAGLC